MVALDKVDLDLARQPLPRGSASIAAVCVLLLGAVVFRSFIFGNQVLLYKDIGSDSINDSYPYFVHLSDYIRAHGMPSWSFCVGMGQSLFYRTGDLLWEPIIWLPRNAIAPALVFQHLFKLLIAGLLFFRFLQLRGLNFAGMLLGTLLVCFSAYACMGGCWYQNTDEIVCFSFILVAIETALVCGRWMLLPLAVAITGLVSVFHFYLAAVLLCLYVPTRLVALYGWRPRTTARTCIQLAALAFLGVGLAAAICFGGAYSVLHSTRGSGAISNFDWAPPPSHLFHLDSARYYLTVALRPFANDLVGTGDAYRGWQNYFEAPATYCGLISLVMLPQIFVGATRRQCLLRALFLACVAIPVIFPWFRYALWMFQGGYFRAFSLFSVLGIVTFSATAFGRYLQQRSLNLWILVATLFALVAVLYLPVPEMRRVIDVDLRSITVVFVIAYGAALGIGQALKRQGVAAWLIIGLTVVELVVLNRKTISGRPTVTKQELADRNGYNDETIDAVREIKANDQSFFRVTKTWSSGPSTRPSLNDAMVFNYRSTSSYSSFNSLNYMNFLRAIDAPGEVEIARFAQWSTGLLGQPLLSTFACEKYVLTENPVLFQTATQYELIKSYGPTYLFRNKLFLPLGLVFDRGLAADLFLQLPVWARREALLHAIVLPSGGQTQPDVAELTLDELKQRLRDRSLPEVIEERRNTAMTMGSFAETRLGGTVKLERPGIVLFQMPFDPGWKAAVDGRAVATWEADIGLLGVPVASGQHMLELNYHPPFLALGIIVTMSSIIILGVTVRVWPRLRLPEMMPKGTT